MDIALKIKYRECQQLIVRTRQQLSESLEHKIISSKNLGLLYKHINSHLTHKSGVVPLEDSTGRLVANAHLQAELLNECFVVRCTPDNHILPALLSMCKTSETISDVTFPFSLVYKLLSKLDVKTSASTDNIPPILIKPLKGVLCGPLSTLFS